MIRTIFFLIFNILRYPIHVLKKNKISWNSRMSSNIKISNSVVGNYTYVGCNTVINNTKIGNYCSIAPGVQIGGMEHSHWWFSTSTTLSDKCISDRVTHIGHDVWIGAGVIVKQGVKIGDGAVIGAMSLVTKDVEANTIVFGIPAKLYKNRFSEEVFKSIQDSDFYNKDSFEAKKSLSRLEEKYDRN
ncbi:CatB-related O-acetyltransferase [Myroides sp. DF42-4-2]|uniref:CatB-related O-acetyltransferase n=1 Tax=Myroides sp. DF42-4-2 TaxID=2746726 RepID=UPI002575409F|nr:CatB-related O-acetyltransferase [Myroides sp. DF42-4-2]MDM1408186.1 CatB-related O-acetyltransferase [Myroides sp. DF42-4-2]